MRRNPKITRGERRAGKTARRIETALLKLADRPKKDFAAVQWFPEVSFLRIDLPDGGDLAYTLLRNRRHSNVAFILGEALRYQVELDSLTVSPRLIGSYPNLMFRMPLADVERFVEALRTSESEDDFKNVFRQWGVRRMSAKFWETLHGFSDFMRRHAPQEAGIYDINRYGRW